MAYVSTIVSGAASLGVLIGLISGIFFLVLTALRWVTRVRESLYEEELRRQKRFLISNSYLVGAGTPDFLDSRKAENGFGKTINGGSHREKKGNFQSNAGCAAQWLEPEADENVSDKQNPNTDTIKVRELIEKMVEAMIEGPLDGTTVGQLSSHSAYLDLFTKYHNLLCRELARLGFALHLSVVRKNVSEFDSTDLSQSNLRRLIKRIVSEAMALPNIKEIARPPRNSKGAVNEDLKNKSYEDILATAILNKVVENFQNKNYSEKEGNPKPRLRRKKIRRNDDSAEVKSDDDWSDTSRSDQLSLTIEEYIEEITTALEASDDERSEVSDFETLTSRRIPFPESGRTVVDAGTDDENSDLEEVNAATQLITTSNTWEENWLFQKKRLRSTPNAHHPVPVPMLVPNPSEDFRALVGGVDADDLSDMSDCGGSTLDDLISTEEKPSEQVTEPEKEIPSVREEGNPGYAETPIKDSFSEKNEVFVVAKCQDYEMAVEECSSTRETVQIVEENPNLPDILSQKDRESSIVDFSHQYESLGSNSPPERATGAETEESTLRSRLSEREKEKWSNPVLLVDNPYSVENIEKREQRKKSEYFRIGTYTGESIDFPEDTSSDEVSKNEVEKLRFTRDYYVNASKHPTGMPSAKRISEDQKFREADEVLPAKQDKWVIGEMFAEKHNELNKCKMVDKSEFCLPSVKELAKHFTREDNKEVKTRNENSAAKLEGRHNGGRESEVDYSITPVSEIILNLQLAAESPPPSENHHRGTTLCHGQPATQMEVCRKVESRANFEKTVEQENRFNGKQVHSLTARSISKEFREGLKNNSYQRNYTKIDRNSSGGESDQGDIISSRIKTSPTPTVDLKNMKKFWEKIITANSNATKQK